MVSSTLETARPRPLWWDDVIAAPSRPPLRGDISVDVAIVGAGFTGLWSAYYLLQADPALRVAVIEREHVGFGASGRNGGFCYDGFAAGPKRIEAMSDLDTAKDWAAALRETVNVIEKTVAAEGIECDFHRGGTIEFLVNGGQQARAAEHVAEARRFGWDESELELLDASEAADIGRAADIRGAMWAPTSASIHPAKLVHGLAGAVERAGGTIFESTEVTAIAAGVIATKAGTVRSPRILRAVEGYTAELAGHRRTLAPLYSLMIATEPLDAALWDEIGLSDRQTFGDLRHLVIYGQRTADGRIAFGGRGAPYDYASRVRRNADFDPSAFTPVLGALTELFPQLRDVRVSHRWGGVLGVSRNWMPTAGLDTQTGIGWAGGYVGSGVAATNLAGRTVADLMLDRDTRLTSFPWVNHRVRRWEPEPLRWLGINAALSVMKRADSVEERTDRPAKSADALWRLVEI